MTTFSAVLAQDRRLAILGTVGFIAALAAASQVAIPIPGTPVPITLQPMVVVLAGMMLGPTLGAMSMVVYLAIGAAGVPVFAPVGLPGIARFLGPTGGYLFAYPVSAYVAGYLAQRMPSLMGRWLAAMLGIVVLFIGGLTQLTILNGGVGRAIALGLTPFAVLDIVKAFVAALIARPLLSSRRPSAQE
jgi:biotin transport system substrate-specific component